MRCDRNLSRAINTDTATISQLSSKAGLHRNIVISQEPPRPEPLAGWTLVRKVLSPRRTGNPKKVEVVSVASRENIAIGITACLTMRRRYRKETSHTTNVTKRKGALKDSTLCLVEGVALENDKSYVRSYEGLGYDVREVGDSERKHLVNPITGMNRNISN